MLSANDMVLLRLFPGAMVSLAEAAHNATFGECSTPMYWPISCQAVPPRLVHLTPSNKTTQISGTKTQAVFDRALAELFLKGSNIFSTSLSETRQNIEFTIISGRPKKREPLLLHAVCITTR
jgi:hypothetical protein